MKKKQKSEIERALEISNRAASLGFDFEDYWGPVNKIREELEELLEVLQCEDVSQARAEDEFGDLFFSVLNLARKINIIPQDALGSTNDKFLSRFSYVEEKLAGEKDATLERMEVWWGEAKKREKA